jgi:hypothetical protein
MSSEDYSLMIEIIKKIEDRFKLVTDKQKEFKNKISNKIDESTKHQNINDFKISIF